MKKKVTPKFNLSETNFKVTICAKYNKEVDKLKFLKKVTLNQVQHDYLMSLPNGSSFLKAGKFNMLGHPKAKNGDC